MDLPQTESKLWNKIQKAIYSSIDGESQYLQDTDYRI